MKKDTEYWILWTLLLLMMILSGVHFINGEVLRGFIDLAAYAVGVYILVLLKGKD